MNNERIEFKLKGIQIESKAMSPPPPISNKEELKFVFEIKLEDRIQVNDKLVLVFVFLKIKHDNYTLAILDTVLAFEVIDFDKFIVLNENGTYHVPPQLDNIIRPVSLSTVRGIVYSEFRGTYLHGAIMPVVYMDQFKDENKVTNKTTEQLQENTTKE